MVPCASRRDSMSGEKREPPHQDTTERAGGESSLPHSFPSLLPPPSTTSTSIKKEEDQYDGATCKTNQKEGGNTVGTLASRLSLPSEEPPGLGNPAFSSSSPSSSSSSFEIGPRSFPPPCPSSERSSKIVVEDEARTKSPVAAASHPSMPQRLHPLSIPSAPTSAPTPTGSGGCDNRKSDVTWKHRLCELREYREQNGNCLVPARYPPNPALGHWVMTQRRQYVLMNEGKPSSLTRERVEELHEIGFTWTIRENNADAWNRQMGELARYKAQNGHCLVPQRYSPNPTLGTWVNTQRRHYKLFMEGKKSSMTPERIKVLEELGFEWKSPKKGSVGTKSGKTLGDKRKRADESSPTGVTTDFHNDHERDWKHPKSDYHHPFNHHEVHQVLPSSAGSGNGNGGGGDPPPDWQAQHHNGVRYDPSHDRQQHHSLPMYGHGHTPNMTSQGRYHGAEYPPLHHYPRAPTQHMDPSTYPHDGGGSQPSTHPQTGLPPHPHHQRWTNHPPPSHPADGNVPRPMDHSLSQHPPINGMPYTNGPWVCQFCQASLLGTYMDLRAHEAACGARPPSYY